VRGRARSIRGSRDGARDGELAEGARAAQRARACEPERGTRVPRISLRLRDRRGTLALSMTRFRARERKTNRLCADVTFRRAGQPGITHLRHGERGAVENRGAHGVSAGLHDTLHCCYRGRCDAECERVGIRRASQARVFDAKRESPSSVGHTF